MLAFLFVSCAGKEATDDPADAFLPGVKIAELNSKELKEISGLAASISNRRMLWAHNDSGNEPEVYLLNEKLEIKLTIRLDGIENRDWEDITVGPGPADGKNYIYVGEIGDNDAQYEYKYIYRFEEPKWSGEHDEKITLRKFDRITFNLSDEVKDTETLMIDPTTKSLYVVSKREEPVYVYELTYPQSTTNVISAAKLFSLPFSKIVGGDVSASGNEILLKNYNHVFYWSTTTPKPFIDILKTEPRQVPYEQEPQGESIALSRDGNGFYTISEKVKKEKSYLYFYQRK